MSKLAQVEGVAREQEGPTRTWRCVRGGVGCEERHEGIDEACRGGVGVGAA
jgi:hypothetical protein